MESRLVSLLSAGDWREAEAAIAAEPVAATPSLLRLLRHEPPFDTDRVRAAFAEKWRDGSVASFNMVLGGLIEAGGTYALEGLIAALDDPRWNVFEQAASAIARLGAAGAPAASALVSHLSTEPRRLRAIDALGRIGPEARVAVPVLLGLLEDRDPIVRSYSVTALSLIGPNQTSIVDAIHRVAREDADPEIRKVARQALG